MIVIVVVVVGTVVVVVVDTVGTAAVVDTAVVGVDSYVASAVVVVVTMPFCFHYSHSQMFHSLNMSHEGHSHTYLHT